MRWVLFFFVCSGAPKRLAGSGSVFDIPGDRATLLRVSSNRLGGAIDLLSCSVAVTQYWSQGQEHPKAQPAVVLV